jgi:hypothetical protein
MVAAVVAKQILAFSAVVRFADGEVTAEPVSLNIEPEKRLASKSRC